MISGGGWRGLPISISREKSLRDIRMGYGMMRDFGTNGKVGAAHGTVTAVWWFSRRWLRKMIN